jgi:hypothetical protein
MDRPRLPALVYADLYRAKQFRFDESHTNLAKPA